MSLKDLIGGKVKNKSNVVCDYDNLEKSIIYSKEP